MARRRWSWIALVLGVATSVLLAGSSAVAQSAGTGSAAAPLSDEEIQVVQTLTSDFPRVEVVVAVPSDVIGADLSPSAFGLVENGIARPIEVGPAETLLEVVVVVDTSGSMRGEPIAAAQAAAKALVDRLPSDAAVAVVGFDDAPRVVASFETPSGFLPGAIDSLRAGGETALFDAIEVAAGAFRGAAEGKHRFVVLLGDGADTTSNASLDDATAALSSTGAFVYTVTLQSLFADFGDLEELTARVGGRTIPATDANQLVAVFDDLGDRLANSYRIRFDSVATTTSELAISVVGRGLLATANHTVDVAPLTGLESPAPTPAPTAAPVVVSEPAVVAMPQPGLLASDTALYLGAGAIFLGLVAVLGWLLGRERDRPARRPRLELRKSAPRGGGLHGIVGATSSVADKMLAHRKQGRDLDAALDRAGVEMRPGEFVTVVAGLAVAAGLLGFVFLGALGAAVLPPVAALMSRVYLQNKANRRRKRFNLQLGDTLVILAGGLRAGHGVMQALDSVAQQADAPTSEEFSRVIAETRIGRDVIDSLEDVAVRTGSEDFVWVVRAIAINRELGGDLAEILDNVGETIRDRTRLRDQVKALSAEGKVSAMILFVLPIGLTLFVRTTNPEYLAEMTDRTGGQIGLGFAAMLMVLGGIWLKKLVSVEY